MQGYDYSFCFDCWEESHPNDAVPDDAESRTCPKHLVEWAADEADAANDDAWMGR